MFMLAVAGSAALAALIAVVTSATDAAAIAVDPLEAWVDVKPETAYADFTLTASLLSSARRRLVLQPVVMAQFDLKEAGRPPC